jgi:hypothetical protein
MIGKCGDLLFICFVPPLSQWNCLYIALTLRTQAIESRDLHEVEQAFEQVLDNVFLMMACDSVPKFQLSPSFRKARTCTNRLASPQHC